VQLHRDGGQHRLLGDDGVEHLHGHPAQVVLDRDDRRRRRKPVGLRPKLPRQEHGDHSDTRAAAGSIPQRERQSRTRPLGTVDPNDDAPSLTHDVTPPQRRFRQLLPRARSCCPSAMVDLYG
jgi:hypothetical protein